VRLALRADRGADQGRDLPERHLVGQNCRPTTGRQIMASNRSVSFAPRAGIKNSASSH
jgi:hypothetical protein